MAPERFLSAGSRQGAPAPCDPWAKRLMAGTVVPSGIFVGGATGDSLPHTSFTRVCGS